MFGPFDKDFCANRTCPYSDQCGRSVKRLDGQHAIVWMMSAKPDENGYCQYEEPYQEYQVPEWMSKMAQEKEKEFDAEIARKQELADAQSLDSSTI